MGFVFEVEEAGDGEVGGVAEVAEDFVGGFFDFFEVGEGGFVRGRGLEKK